MNDSMRGRVCVVTGANAGMGRVTAEELARRGATVVLLTRSRERGEAAREEIAKATGNEAVELVVADLASQRQVRAAAAEITAAHGDVSVLVNNAGVILARHDVTEDGVERTFATNYLGHVLLTDLLLDALTAAAPSRIVNVSARTGRYTIDLGDLGFVTRKYSAFSAASQSKLAIVIATVERAERLAGTGVTANAVYPGLVRTGVAKELPAGVRALLSVVSTNPGKGARTAIRVSSAPEFESVSGKLLGPRGTELKLPAQATDGAVRRRLWDLSVDLTQRDAVPV